MTHSASVLVVDADWAVLDALSRALRARGHGVTLATNGRSGLESAVAVAPDVVLVSQDVDVVDLRTFLEVLRDNPKTTNAALFVMGERERLPHTVLGPRIQLLVKPLHAEEIVLRIEELMRVKTAVSEQPELHGDLAQVALFDLLQMFGTNRRSGTLTVDTAKGRAELGVRNGDIVDASFGRVVGEKALYRLLAETAGQFAFLPHRKPARTRIELGTGAIVMEAARQADEVAKLREELPPGDVWLRTAQVPDDVHGLPRSIALAAQDPQALDEIVDSFGRTDLDVLGALRELIASGVLVIDDAQPARSKLCEEDERVVVSAAALRLRRPGVEGASRIGVTARRYEDLARFIRALGKIEEFVPDRMGPSSVGTGSFGAIGVVRLIGIDVELFALPLDPSVRPLWSIALSSSRALLWLDEQEPLDDESDLLDRLGVACVAAQEGWERPRGAAASIRRALGAVGGATLERS